MVTRARRAVALAGALTACLLAASSAGLAEGEDISPGPLRIVHLGQGVFSLSSEEGSAGASSAAVQIDLRRIRHGYDPAVDSDVPRYTNVTLNDEVPHHVDSLGRDYATITLYQVDPPLADLPSREPGIDRGIDMRSPADMVKSAYSNYVSPVFTDDSERRPVPNHPIGHFFVKVEIGGYPTLLTGMTTIQRADTELVDQTLGHGLGIGGVLLTPQPGRLNSAEEALEELSLRQQRLRVVDGLYYRREGKKNVGPEYVIEDGNVVFARFKLPLRNATDALAVFVEFVWREQHRIFGSLVNRPYRGTGAGCTPFAMSWLKAAGAIPFVAEPADAARPADDMRPAPEGAEDFWQNLLRRANIPWAHIGCDQRVGVDRPLPADYTVYDLLFHDEQTSHLLRAIPGLAEKIRQDQGTIVSTLFAFGALTPLRDIVIAAKRKDPRDLGSYGWAEAGEGLPALFWDNGRFSDWIKQLWRSGETPPRIELVKEGRFLGIAIDDMDTPRQREPFYAEADRIHREVARWAAAGKRPTSCEGLFRLGFY